MKKLKIPAKRQPREKQEREWKFEMENVVTKMVWKLVEMTVVEKRRNENASKGSDEEMAIGVKM